MLKKTVGFSSANILQMGNNLEILPKSIFKEKGTKAFGKVMQIESTSLPFTFEGDWIRIPEDKAFQIWEQTRIRVLEYTKNKHLLDPNFESLSKSHKEKPCRITGHACSIAALGKGTFCVNLELEFGETHGVHIYAFNTVVTPEYVAPLVGTKTKAILKDAIFRWTGDDHRKFGAYHMDASLQDRSRYVKFYAASVGSTKGVFIPIESKSGLKRWIKPANWNAIDRNIPDDKIASISFVEDNIFSVCILTNNKLFETKIKLSNYAAVTAIEEHLLFNFVSKENEDPLAVNLDQIRYFQTAFH